MHIDALSSPRWDKPCARSGGGLAAPCIHGFPVDTRPRNDRDARELKGWSLSEDHYSDFAKWSEGHRGIHAASILYY